MTFEVLIRGGTVVLPSGAEPLDVGVLDGRIAALERDLPGPAREERDARGLHVLPGAVDPHVHFDEPGRTHWEGWASGTRALAAGGATTGVEMPLNAHPPTTTAAAFDAKLAAARRAAVVDFGLWGGIVPGNAGELEELWARGVAGFKAFMCASGIGDFARSDEETLGEAMRICARLGALVAVHAEDEALTAELTARARAEGRTGARGFLDSRPVEAELRAIERALALAEETGCALHVVHVSTGRGVALVARARERGVDATCETCPHYLVLDEEDLERLGAVAKCAPPLRPAAEQDALWSALADGTLEIVASDHSPCPPEMKEATLLSAWGGIAGCQSTLPLLLDAGHHARGLALPRVAELAAGAAARRLRLPGKGTIALGADADLALVDLHAPAAPLRAEDLHYRHRISPYVGRALRGRVAETRLRGALVHRDGHVFDPPGGRLVRPASIHDPEVTPTP